MFFSRYNISTLKFMVSLPLLNALRWKNDEQRRRNLQQSFFNQKNFFNWGCTRHTNDINDWIFFCDYTLDKAAATPEFGFDTSERARECIQMRVWLSSDVRTYFSENVINRNCPKRWTYNLLFYQDSIGFLLLKPICGHQQKWSKIHFYLVIRGFGVHRTNLGRIPSW